MAIRFWLTLLSGFLGVSFLGATDNGNVSKIYQPTHSVGTTVFSITSSSLSSASTASNGQFVISTSGRYFLSTDLMAAPARSNLACIYINTSDVVLDLGGKTITLSTSTNQKNSSAIEIATGLSNITIMNGTINGKSTLVSTTTGIKANTNLTNLFIDNVHVVNCATEGINLNTVTGIVLNNVHLYNNGSQTNPANTSMARGLVLTSCSDISIIDSTFNKTTAPSAVPAYGIYAAACNNLTMSNIQVCNTTAATGIAKAIYLSACAGVMCDSVKALRSSSTGSLGTSIVVAGIDLAGSTGSTFSNCIANNGLSTIATSTTYGFRLAEGSNSNSFTNCEAKGNLGGGTTSGFQLSSSHSNFFQTCLAIGNGGASRATYGFQSGIDLTTTCSSGFFKACKSIGNTATKGASYGFTLLGATSSTIQACEANGNIASTKSYGIALLRTCIKSTIQYNTMLANIGTGGAYGFKDFANNSTALIRGNISFAHGQTLNSAASAFLSDSGSMNYFFTYTDANMHSYNQIKELDLSNIIAQNLITPTWSNISITQIAIA